MELWTGSNGTAAALLTVPRSDWVDSTTGRAVVAAAAAAAAATATSNSNATDASNGKKPLVLLQLPAGWTAQHLQGSSLVVHKHVSLLSERQGCTFAVHTVETSNASVLLRPPKAETEDTGEVQGSDDPLNNALGHESSPTKRRKLLALVDGTVSRVVDARLLRPSGSSFLELRPRPLEERALEKALDVHCPHNGSHEAVGQTVLQLARRLPASLREVRDGLRSIQAYPLPSPRRPSDRDDMFIHPLDPPPRFARLSEQARHEAAEAIVAALHELGVDYAGSEGGIGDVSSFVQHVLARQSDDERFQDNAEEAARVLRFALYELRDDDDNNNDNDDCDNEEAFDRWLQFLQGSPGSDASAVGAPTTVRLSVRKVAACVARRLFLLQSHPWDPALLLARWQADLPGVGDPYIVDTSMLRGLAVPVPANDNNNETTSTGAQVGNESTLTTDQPRPQILWKYVPVDGLPPDDPAQGIEALFRHNSRWTEEELLPYLERYATAARLATDLLARFTKADGRSADMPDNHVKYVVQR